MWQHLVYITGLLLAILGMGLFDYRYKLAFFKDRRRTFRTLLPAIGVFVLWDILGIVLGIFSDGGGVYSTGLMVGKDFPFEELFFLILLTYTALLVWRALEERSV
jgi:lycopene cyclase domain-containing protein